jgi:ribose/xylose/arabinose/galactoside ABC-type transport system permease subunit
MNGPSSTRPGIARQLGLMLGQSRRRNALALPALIFCIALVLLGASRSDAFLSSFNIGNVLVQVTALLLVSIGQTYAVASGGLDLSVGSIVSLSAVVTAISFDPLGLPVAVLLGIVAGLAIGLINGFAIASGLEPFLVTLATLSIAQGAALFVSPVPGGTVPAGYAQIARFWGPLPVALPFVLLAVLLAAWSMARTRTGAHVLAIGGSEDVARLSGVPIRRTYVKAYVLSAALAVLAALFLVARTRTGDPTIGAVFTLDSLAAVVLGGTVLGGGRATMLGSMLGALALGLLSNVLNLLQVPTFYQTPVKGLLVIGAVLLPNVGARIVCQRRRAAQAEAEENAVADRRGAYSPSGSRASE